MNIEQTAPAPKPRHLPDQTEEWYSHMIATINRLPATLLRRAFAGKFEHEN